MQNEKHIDKDLSERKKIEFEKLKTDLEISKQQLKFSSKTQKLEFIKIILPFLTIIVTIVGFYITFYSQQKQVNLLQKQHAEEAFAKDIQQLAFASNEASKIVALSTLSTYFNHDSVTDKQLINLFLSYAESDSLESVRSFIANKLSDKVALKLLPTLIERNIQLQAKFPPNINLSDAPVFTNYESISQSLNWNINAIILCINKLKDIRNFDFSRTILNRPLKTFELPDEFKPAQIFDNILTNTVITDIKFTAVSFNNSFLDNLHFENVQFQKCTFDSSSLTNTLFRNCNFIRSSFKDFSWGAGFFESSDPNLIFMDTALSYFKNFYEPKWEKCIIDFTNFLPICPALYSSKYSLKFDDSKWKIDTINCGNKPCCDLTKSGDNY